jgi:hypothetical protein
MRKDKIAAMKNTTILALIVAVLIGLGWFMKPTAINGGVEKVENIVTLEYHRNFTVELYNGKVDAVYVDQEAYNTKNYHCTKVQNDEAHNCMLTDTLEMWQFLNKIGY